MELNWDFFYIICHSCATMSVTGKDFLNPLVWFFNNMEFLTIGISYLKKKWTYPQETKNRPICKDMYKIEINL